MARPGVEVSIRDTPVPRGAELDTGRWFVAGLSERGALAPIEVRSLGQFTSLLGARRSDSPLYDSVEAFFREGGSVAIVSRVAGAAAVDAVRVLNDAGAAASLTVKALGPGAWGNALTVQVTAGDVGGEFKLVIAYNAVTVEQSPSLVDTAAAAAWSLNSAYVRITATGANDPVVIAAQALAGGTDDTVGVNDASWQAALDRLPRSLGPGQVSAPGRTTTVGHQQLLAHAGANNRVAIMDAVDTAVVATHTAEAVALKVHAHARRGALFAPWTKIVGLVPGTKRTIPYSGVQAGLLARIDQGPGPHHAAAGETGISASSLEVTQTWTDPERETLNAAGVNVARVLYGEVRTYGHRSLADPVSLASWRDLGSARVVMAIHAEADAIGESHVFRPIDGKGHLLSEYQGALAAMLRRHYERGALYGETPNEAFKVDVGPAVNTPATIANGELRAVLAFRVSPMAELVVIELVKVATGEALT